MSHTPRETGLGSHLLREAAEWRLISLLLECPGDGWQDEIEGLAAEVADPGLHQAVELAFEQASAELYHTAFGPGGPARPREVSHRDGVQAGRFLAEICDYYRAFAYTPNTPETPDHVATEAGFVAYLRLKEAYARASGDDQAAALCRRAADRFVEEHLSVIARPLAENLEASAIGYLACAGTALVARAG